MCHVIQLREFLTTERMLGMNAIMNRGSLVCVCVCVCVCPTTLRPLLWTTHYTDMAPYLSYVVCGMCGVCGIRGVWARYGGTKPAAPTSGR